MYRTSYKSAKDILARVGTTHIQIHPGLIVRRDYILEYLITLRLAKFTDGTSAFVSEGYIHDIQEEMEYRKTKNYGRIRDQTRKEVVQRAGGNRGPSRRRV